MVSPATAKSVVLALISNRDCLPDDAVEPQEFIHAWYSELCKPIVGPVVLLAFTVSNTSGVVVPIPNLPALI